MGGWDGAGPAQDRDPGGRVGWGRAGPGPGPGGRVGWGRAGPGPGPGGVGGGGAQARGPVVVTALIKKNGKKILPEYLITILNSNFFYEFPLTHCLGSRAEVIMIVKNAPASSVPHL